MELGEWSFISKITNVVGHQQPAANPPPVPPNKDLLYPSKSQRNKLTLNSLVTSAKTRLYNYYRPLKNSLPPVNPNEPIWILGVPYLPYLPPPPNHSSFGTTEKDTSVTHDGLEDFLLDFRSRIWFTYRTNFTPLYMNVEDPSQHSSDNLVTTDVGWGCMLRCTQMLIAQALVQSSVGRQFRLPTPSSPNPTPRGVSSSLRDASSTPPSLNTSTNSTSSLLPSTPHPTFHTQQIKDLQTHKQIIKLFHDSPMYPLSIHNITSHCLIHYKHPITKWYDSSTLLFSLQSILFHSPPLLPPPFPKLHLYISQSMSIFPCQFLPLLSSSSSPSSSSVPTNSILIAVPYRIASTTAGVPKELQKRFREIIKEWLTWECCVGILGGKPNSAYYIVGWSEAAGVFYLDPHFVKKEGDGEEINLDETTGNNNNDVGLEVLANGGVGAIGEEQNGYRMEWPQWMEWDAMDASVTVGFVVKSVEEWQELRRKLEEQKVVSVEDVVPEYIQCNDFLLSNTGQGTKSRGEDDGEEDELCIEDKEEREGVKKK